MFFDYQRISDTSLLGDVIRAYNDLVRKLLERDRQPLTPYQVRGKVTTFNSSTGTTYNLEKDDGVVLVDTGTASVNLYLRDASENNINKARLITIKKTSGSNSLIINAASGQTIDGSGTITLTVLNDVVRLVSDGFNWWKV